MDRLTSLMVFGRVVDCGGFSAAARKLNMSTTMVCNHVQFLEERLGVRLLSRTTRKVSVTETGRYYYERSAQILADLDEADRSVGSLATQPRGTLRIHTSTHIVRFLSPIVSEFLELYPSVQTDVSIGERMVDLIEDGYDLAIRTVPMVDSSLIVRRLTPWRHVLCCSPGYLAKHPEPKDLSELTSHNCLRYALYPYGNEWRFETENGEAKSIRIGGNFVSNSAEMLRHMALDGRGIFLAPIFVARDDLERGDLRQLLPQMRPVEFVINAIYPNRNHLPTKVRLFIDLLAERFVEHRRWMA